MRGQRVVPGRMLTDINAPEDFRSAQSGDGRALEKLIKENYNLAVAFAKGWSNTNVPFEDKVSAALEGLLVAIQRFDPDKGFRFSTYATKWMLDKVQQESARWSLVHVPVRALKRFYSADADLGPEERSMIALALFGGVGGEDLQTEATYCFKEEYLDAHKVAVQAAQTSSEKEFRVFSACYFDGYSVAEISRAMGIASSTAHNMLARSEFKVKRAFGVEA